MITHLSIIGPMGIGKSTLIDQLEKEGFKVIKDPVLDIVEANQGLDNRELQKKIIKALYQQRLDHRYENVIFDTSPFMSWIYTLSQAAVSEIRVDQLIDSSLIYDTYKDDYEKQIGNSIKNIEYVLTDVNHSNVQNVISRGRPWEQGSKTLKDFDATLSRLSDPDVPWEELNYLVPKFKFIHERYYSYKNIEAVNRVLFMVRKLMTHEEN